MRYLGGQKNEEKRMKFKLPLLKILFQFQFHTIFNCHYYHYYRNTLIRQTILETLHGNSSSERLSVIL